MFGIFRLDGICTASAFIAIAFGISNQGNRIASMKLTAGIILFFPAWCSLLRSCFRGDAVDGLFDPGAVSEALKSGWAAVSYPAPLPGAAPASWHGRHSTAFVGVGDYLHSYYHRAFVVNGGDFWQMSMRRHVPMRRSTASAAKDAERAKSAMNSADRQTKSAANVSVRKTKNVPKNAEKKNSPAKKKETARPPEAA